MSENKILILLPMVMTVFSNAYADDAIAEMLEVRSDILVGNSNIEFVERSLEKKLAKIQRGQKLAKMIKISKKLAKIRKMKDINVRIMAMIMSYIELAALDLAVNEDVYRMRVHNMMEEIVSMFVKSNDNMANLLAEYRRSGR